MAKKTATKGTRKTSTASRKKGPVRKTTRKSATKKLSGLDAAAQVLADAGEPLRCREIVDRMLEKQLWSTNGATPHATIYAALVREIAGKGSESRFKKTGRGLFTLNDAK